MDIHTRFHQLEEENIQLKNRVRDIRLQLEQEREKNINQYLNIPIPYITINFKGDILNCNKAACVFFGRKAERLRLDNIIEFLDIDSKGRMTLFCQMMEEERLRKQIEKSEIELNFFVRGKRYETISHYSIVPQEQQLVLEFAIWDMTEANETKRQLKKEHECYQIALKTSSDYIFEYYIEEDRVFEYGDFTRPEIPKTRQIIKENFLKTLAQKQKEITDSYRLMRQIMLGEKMSGEIDLSKVDYYNEDRWAYIELSPISDIFVENRIIGRICDITEQKKKELKEKEASYFDEITGLYHSQYGINLIVEKLKEASQKRKRAHLFLMTVNIEMNMKKNYGFTFARGILSIIGMIIKKKKGQSVTAIRCGSQEFLFLIEEAEEIGIQFAESLLKELQKQYCGTIPNGMVFYRGIFMKNIQWTGYPDWGKVIQSIYKKKEDIQEETMIVLDGTIPMEFCDAKEGFPLQYNGTSKIYYTKTKPIFSYAYDLLEHSKNTESVLLLLMNMIGIYKELKYISIYELNQAYLSKYLLYHWNEEAKDLEGEIVTYCPSQEEWKQLFQWEDESRCWCQPAKQIEEQKSRGWFLDDNEGKTSQIVCLSEENREYQFLIVYGFPKEKESWSKEEKEFYQDFAKILFIGMNQNKESSFNKTKSMFLARMSHEIRTPISGIVGTMQLLETAIKGQEQIECSMLVSLLEQMECSMKKLLKVTDSVLDMAQIEDYSMKLTSESFQMKLVLIAIRRQFEEIAKEKQIQFHYHEGTLIEELYGDAKRVYQVLSNLLENAMKYTKENGTVSLRVDSRIESETSVVYEMIIEDDGCGIAEEVQEQIFEVFSESSNGRQGEGIGLGLSISKALVGLMGGTLHVKSEEGIGTKIHLSIPFKIKEKQKNQVGKACLVRLNGLRILLVEDNELNAMIVRELLELDGAEVEIATDGIEAVEQFQKSEIHYYDVILMDIRMPHMDGFQATKKIRSLEREDARTVLVIALSAELLEEDEKQIIEVGLNGHLTKPLRIGELKELLGSQMEIRRLSKPLG